MALSVGSAAFLLDAQQHCKRLCGIRGAGRQASLHPQQCRHSYQPTDVLQVPQLRQLAVALHRHPWQHGCTQPPRARHAHSWRAQVRVCMWQLQPHGSQRQHSTAAALPHQQLLPQRHSLPSRCVCGLVCSAPSVAMCFVQGAQRQQWSSRRMLPVLCMSGPRVHICM